ncbi:MAG: isochorismate synthase [Tannerellaceae bacterium]|jgi:isochorismate synthase|nr:isochorismate synthase [Tannerellaceae bacterium]
MTHNWTENLDALIEQNRCFALYRIPQNNYAHLLLSGNEPPQQLCRIDALNHQSGFVMAPFQVSKSCPVVLFHPRSSEQIPLPPGDTSPHTDEYPFRPAAIEAAYAKRFRTFMDALREERFRKLVLSRKATIRRSKNFSPAQTFLRACRYSARSYAYLFHSPPTGTWLGCTPELLLAGEKNQFRTVALAGTQTLKPGPAPVDWDDKNLAEQMLVARYVHAQLATLGIRPDEDGPYTIEAGRLAHLQTDFRFSFPEAGKLGDLLRLLHPTPAVSGLPKEEACRFIPEHEGYNRRYYSGFAGWIDAAGRTDLYVNLRCMYIQRRCITLYAGGGLLPSSLPEKEWQETENKLQTMLSILS